MNHKYDYIIYHKNCLDGFFSVVILKYLNIISSNCFIFADVPSNINKIPINIENKKVIIVDVAYHVDMIKKICNIAKEVLYIDHHITHEKDIISLNFKNLIKVINTQTFSACYLTWKYFSKEKVPQIVKYISDNDTGTWKYKYTNMIITTLNVEYKIDINKINDWITLFDKNNLKKLIKKGKQYMNYTEYLLEKTISQHTIVTFPTRQLFKKYPKIANKENQYKVAIHNGACPTTTLVGNYLLKNVECDFVVVYSYNLEKHKYTISFRSKKINVESIAKILGGGGHKYAASCQINSSEFHLEDLFEVIQ